MLKSDPLFRWGFIAQRANLEKAELNIWLQEQLCIREPLGASETVPVSSAIVVDQRARLLKSCLTSELSPKQ